jgi:predicted amidohydrolase
MKTRIGLIQLTSVLEASANLKKIEQYLGQAQAKKVSYVFLPECFYSMSDGLKPTPYLVSEGNEHFKAIGQLAKKYGVNILGGSVAYLDQGVIKNRNLNFSSKGELLGYYDKRYLFNCNIKLSESERKVIDEANVYTSGHGSLLLDLDQLKIGMGICFDLRFPDFWMSYRKKGANLLSISSAFTVPTGKAHWHTLLRARAIETQCFVIASAQVGVHNERMSTYGHSLIINPWGEVLLDAKEEEGFFSAEIDLKEVGEVRAKVGVERYL